MAARLHGATAGELPLGAARSVPADALLHPAALAAIGLLLVNDHVLKVVAPGFVTGKLSDVAGLAFFPLVLVGLWEVALGAFGRWREPSVHSLVTSVVLTTVAFGLVKATSIGASAFAAALGAAQWIVGATFSLGQASGEMAPALIVQDPSDLLALPAVLVALWIGRSRLRPGAQP